MRPSALPDTTPVPSALNAAAVTGSECDAIVRRHFPVATSQIFTFSSKDPLTCQTAKHTKRSYIYMFIYYHTTSSIYNMYVVA